MSVGIIALYTITLQGGRHASREKVQNNKHRNFDQGFANLHILVVSVYSNPSDKTFFRKVEVGHKDRRVHSRVGTEYIH